MSRTLSVATADPDVCRVAVLLDRLFPPPRTFSVRLWTGDELPAEGEANLHLTFNQSGAPRRMLTPPIARSIGEAYIYGDLDIEGDIFSAFALLSTLTNRSLSLGESLAVLSDWLALPRDSAARPAGRRPAQLSGALHSRERDRAAIQYHYNAGNEFYALWLDRRMQYSCAYFQTGSEDLDTAQGAKLEHICRKLRLRPGERLLDIGCGWGGLAMYAAEQYGAQVVGVTLSDKQADYAQTQVQQAGLNDRVSIRLQDYRDLYDEQFDKIVSVGMFEHVGRSHLPEYFSQAYRLLKPGGLFLNHGIASWPGRPFGQQSPKSPQEFVRRHIINAHAFARAYVFPDGELEPVSEVNLLAERCGFEVRDVENLREHYAHTLRHWVNRLEAHHAQALQLAGEVTYRTWRLYMAVCAYGFATSKFNVNQTLLARLSDGKCSVPLTRADLYA